MKDFINQVKAGVVMTPALLVYLYLLFGILDLSTTYLASPDLRYEGNWIVRKFNFNWVELILYALLNYSITILLVGLSINYIFNYFRKKYSSIKTSVKKRSTNKLIFLLCFVVLGVFYSHFLCVSHVIVNNFLGFIYLKGNQGWLKEISNYYIKNQKYFLFYIQYVLYIPGFILAFIKVNNLRKKAVAEKHSVTTE